MSEPSLDRRRLLQVGGAGLLGALAPGATAEDSRPVWQSAPGGAVRTSPTVVDGTVYVGAEGTDQDGAIRALDAGTGESRWTVGVDGPDPLSPTVVDGLVVGGGLTEVVALTADGEQVWRRDQTVASTPAMADGRVVLGTETGGFDFSPGQASVEALRAGSGQRRWRFEPDEEHGAFSTPVVVDGTVYVSGSGGDLYALDVTTGDRVWRTAVAAGVPTVANGVVYAGIDEFVAIDAATGDRLWETTVGGELVGPPTVADGTGFVADREGQLHALDTESGDLGWTTSIGGDLTVFGDGFQSVPTVADGTVFAAVGAAGPFEQQGELAAFEAATGEELWRATLGTAVESSPTVVDGTVYIGGLDGRVYAFDPPVEESSGGSRVLLGTLGHHGAWADQAPTARFDLRPADPAVGESVTLDATLTSGDIETYAWDIAGETATGRTVERSFQTAGGREVTLTATGGGETRTATARVGVSPPRSWETDPGSEFAGAPTVVDGVVYAGGADGLVAVDAATGDTLWTREEVSSGSAPTVVDGTLYAGGPSPPEELHIDFVGESQVYALDAESGTERWTVDLDALSTQPTVADGSLYVGTSDGHPNFGGVDGAVHALTVGGDRRWQRPVEGRVTARPAIADGTLYVGSYSTDGGRVYALDTVTGDERWSVELDAAVRSSPAVADGVVYVASGATGTGFFGQPDEGLLTALDTATGDRLWTVPLDGVVNAPTVADEAVFVGRQGVGANIPGQVLSFDAATGERLWRMSVDDVVTSLTVADGVVYAGDGDGRMYALDAATGDREWRADAGPGVTVADGTLYAGGSDGLAALDITDEATSEDSAVRLGTRGHTGSWADQTPAATFAADPSAPEVDTPVTLDATATTGDIETYGWDLTGDGGTDATGPTVTHAFERLGTREVTLTATGGDGETATATRILSVGPATRWAFDAGEGVSSATVVDGRVFVGGGSGVHALDAATGSEHWTVGTDGSAASSPTVVDGVVFAGGAVASSNPAVRALDAETGERYWQTALDGEVVTSPTVVDGTVYVGTAQGGVYALAAASGGELWRTGVEGAALSSPTAVDGTVFVGGASSITALDTVDGSTVWTAETGDSSLPVASSPTVTEGVVYAGGAEGLVAVDATTGDTLWTADTGGPVRSSPTVADGSVFVGSADRTVRAFDATTGEEAWRVETGGPVDASPTVAGGRLYVGSTDGRFYALDAATGSEQWRSRLASVADSGRESPDQLPPSPTVVDGTVYAGGPDGRLYALDPPVEESSVDSRVGLGTLGHRGDWEHADQSLDMAGASNPNGSDNQGDDDPGGGDDGFGPGPGPGTALAGLGGAYLLGRLRGGDDETR